MPPQISDDEASVSGSESSSAVSEPQVPVKQESKGKGVKKEFIKEEIPAESDIAEDEDDEVGEDEYIVEKITDHLVDDESGQLRFQIKWEGYENEEDQTWEPEENLETAAKILTAYLKKIGGKEKILKDWAAKKSSKGGKKRGRASTGAEASENGAKRGRKTYKGSEEPPASAKKAEFKPPSGSWEDEIVHIDACEGTEGAVVVYITWKGGQKTQHPLAQVYKRCPQRMLKFYESHLVFKRTDDA